MKRRTLIVMVCGSLLTLAACQTTQHRQVETPAKIDGPSISFDIRVKRPQFLDDDGWRNVTAKTRLPIHEDGRFSGNTAFDAFSTVAITGLRRGPTVELDLKFVRKEWIDRLYSNTLTLAEGKSTMEEKTTGFGVGEPTSGPLLFTMSIEVDGGTDG